MGDFDSMATGIGFTISIIFPFLIASRIVTGDEDPKSKPFKKKIVWVTLILVALINAIGGLCWFFYFYPYVNPDFNSAVLVGRLIGELVGQYITCNIAFFWTLKRRRKSKANIAEDTSTMEVSTESGLIKDSHKEQQDSEKTVVGCENMTSESVAKETYATSNEPISDALNDTSRGLISSTSEDEKSDNELGIEQIISDSDNSLLRRSMLFIEERNWKEAEKRIEQELDESPENGEAYLLSLFVETKSTSFNELINKSKNVVSTSKFKFAKRFADDNTNKFIQAIENAALPNNSKNNKKPFKISKLCTALKKNKAVTALIICLAICVCFTGWISIKLMKMKEERDSYKTIFENMYFDNLVFTFDGDSHYHRYGCPLTPMDSDKTQDYSYSCYDIENAESKGYIPCEYCFDNSNNFDLQDYEDFYVVGNY